MLFSCLVKCMNSFRCVPGWHDSCNIRQRWDMRNPYKYEDPRRVVTHASLYLWRQWRLYQLPAWQDAMSILRRARIDVEEEDQALFMENLDLFVVDPVADAASNCKRIA
jgi:hypothetical protein